MQSNEPENWKPIVGYERRYEVSSRGRVRSSARGPGRSERVRSLSADRYGYLTVGLSRDGKQTTHRVHVLVAVAFHGERPAGLQARHLNGNQTDNRADNLAWGTRVENARDKIAHGTHPYISKPDCPRGHQLVAPNLMPSNLRRGNRACLACSRERANARYQGRAFDQVRADDHFASIARGAV